MSEPPHLICPITRELFVDPVSAEDGHTYDRAAIMQWLNSGNHTSPLTNQRITVSGLRPNYNIRSQVIEYKERQRRQE